MKDTTRLPDEWLECHFTLKNGETFNVDYEYVETDYTEANGQFREGTVRRWTLSTETYSRELTEEEVSSVVIVIKDEYQDTALELEDGDPDEAEGE